MWRCWPRPRRPRPRRLLPVLLVVMEAAKGLEVRQVVVVAGLDVVHIGRREPAPLPGVGPKPLALPPVPVHDETAPQRPVRREPLPAPTRAL